MQASIRPSALLRDTPLLALLLPLSAGIVTADSCFDLLSPYCTYLPIAALAVVLLCVLIRRRQSPERASLTTLVCAIVVPFYCGATLLILDRQDEAVTWPETDVTVKVMVTDVPKTGGAVSHFTGRIVAVSGAGESVRMSVADTVDADSDASAAARLLPGDLLLCHTRFSPPYNSGNPDEFDYASWLRRQGVTGTGFCYSGQWKTLSPSEEHQPSLTTRALRFRSSLTERYAAHLSGRELAVISALTLGDKSKVDAATRGIYANSGTSHVLALSGLHLGILFSIYNFFILGLCRKRRALFVAMSLVGLVMVWAFALLAGFPYSLLRAASMFTLAQLSALLRRESLSIDNLALAATLILLFSPQALFDVGLQLSCLSVFAIILFHDRFPVPKVVGRFRAVRYVYDIFKISLIAQLATAPVVAYYFHILPTYGLLANFVAVPLAYVLLAVAIVFFLLPFLQQWLAVVLDVLLKVMNGALDALSSLPGSVVTLYPSKVGVALCYFFMGLCVASLMDGRRRRRYGLCAVGSLLLLVGTEGHHALTEKLSPQVVFYNARTATPIHFIASAGQSYLWQTRQLPPGKRDGLDYVKSNFWKRHRLADPVTFSTTVTDSAIFSQGGVTQFGRVRVAVVSEDIKKKPPTEPLAVDYLFVERGSRRPLSELLAFYKPAVVVLSPSLTDYHRRRYADEARSLRLSLYDVQTQGALQVALP